MVATSKVRKKANRFQSVASEMRDWLDRYPKATRDEQIRAFNAIADHHFNKAKRDSA